MAKPTNSLQVAFGHTVRRLREERDLSQEELGVRTGLHRNHIGEIERAETNATLKTLDLLAQALDVAPSVLIAQSEEQRE